MKYQVNKPEVISLRNTPARMPIKDPMAALKARFESE